MSLTPNSVRADLKCGRGAISKGEKCTKGTAYQVVEKAAPLALGLGLAAGAIALRRRGKKPRIGDGRTVPNIPKTPPKPRKVSSPASKAQAEAMATRVTERVQQRVRENPQQVAYEMEADKVKRAALRDVVNSKDFQDVFKSKVLTIEEIAELARDPKAFKKKMGRRDALTPSTVRADLKCGKGAISKGEKCTKGTPTEAKKSTSGMVSKALMVGGGVAGVAGAAFAAKKVMSMKGRVAKFNKRAESGDRTTNTPEAKQKVMNKVFNEGSQAITGAQVAGAGLSLAGAGLAAYGVENKQQAAILGGATLSYLGSSAAIGGFSQKRKLGEMRSTANEQAEQYTRNYNEARRAAQAREKANQASGSRGSRNVGANKAVPEPFKDLGLSERASDSEIKKQWLKLMRANHPDAGGDPKKAQQINAAYQEILRRRGKLDSIYADGFDIDWSAITL